MISRDSLVGLVSVTAIGGIIGRAAQFSIYLIIGRQLGPAALGFFSIGFVILNIGTIIGQFGLGNAVKRYVPAYRESGDDKELSGIIVLSLFLSLLGGGIFAILLLLFPTVLEFFLQGKPHDSIVIFLFSIPFLSMLKTGMSATKGYLETKYAVYAKDVVQSISALLLVGFCAVMFGTIESVVVGYVISIFLGCVSVVYFLYQLGAFSELRNPVLQVRKTLYFSLPLMFSAAAQYLVTWTDILMLGALTPANEVGVYQAAFQTASLLGFGLVAVNSIFPTLISGLHSNSEKAQIRLYYITITKWVGTVTCLGGVYLILFSESLLSLFGSGFSGAPTLLTILTVGFVANAAIGPAGYLLAMTDYERAEAINSLLVAILNILLNYILIIEFGVLGAAFATVSSLIVLNVLRAVEIHAFLSIRPSIVEYRNLVIPFTLSIGVMLLLRPVSNFHPVFTVVIGATALGAFFATSYLSGLSEKDVQLLNSL